MKITSIRASESGAQCLNLLPEGMKKEDGIVTLTEAAVVAYCLGEGIEGLCTRRFKADLVVDQLDRLQTGQIISSGTAQLKVTERRKRCHPGCDLEAATCFLLGHVYFLEVMEEGILCVGDHLESMEKD